MSAIITLRADFYGRVAEHPELALVEQRQYLVGPLSEPGPRRAIERPAAELGVFFDSGLVETIIHDALAQPGSLPLLQHALQELWNAPDKAPTITRAAYDTIGGLVGALTKRADELLQSFPKEDQELCRQIFVRLVRPGEGSEDTRRRVRRGGAMRTAGT